MNSMKLPKKITPCPIIDSLLEIRFDTNLPTDAIFGIVYNSIKDKYKNVENLPILQLPEPVRRKDPNLKFKPYYKISNDNYVIQIGADVLTISSYPKYTGWIAFQKEINYFLLKINELAIIDNISRIGLHVIDFFPETEIFSESKISITFDENIIESNNSLFRTEFSHKDNIKSILNISNNASFNLKKGSLIDIDTYVETKQSLNIDQILPQISQIHDTEKELFFSLLKNDFINKFNPEY